MQNNNHAAKGVNKSTVVSAAVGNKLPNFLGDDFLLIASNLFLNEAGLIDATDEVKSEFIGRIMPDFLEKATAMILNELTQEQLPEAIKIAESGMTYNEREISLTALLPGFVQKMSQLMDLYKRKIGLGIYNQ